MSQLHRGDVVSAYSQVSDIDTIVSALEGNRFYIRAQPIVPVLPALPMYKKTEILIGFDDDIIRSRNLSVLDVVELLEKHQRTDAMDGAVIDTILGYMEEKHPSFDGDVQVFINLSGATLNNDRFLQRLVELIERHRFLAENICFELTERVRIQDCSRVREFMQLVRLYGCQFALDDFGVGCSPFDYLMNLPVDYIKIDGSYITLAGQNREAIAILKGIVLMSQSLGIKTIAECVETKDQYDMVKFLNIDYAQGRLFSMPEAVGSAPAHSLEAFSV